MALVDCYAELIAYTGYLLRDWRERPISQEDASRNYDILIARAQECTRASGFSEEDWMEALYPVCAWIDEAILCSEWPGGTQWEHHQLQRTYFHTTSAGTEFFTRLEGMGENAQAVREVYAYCLAMGFRGRYYQDTDAAKLEEIRSRNLAGLAAESMLFFPEALFPDAYESVLTVKKRKKKVWRGVSFFSVLTFVLPVLVFGGLFSLYDNMLSNEVANYLGLDVTPIYQSAFFKDRVPKLAERLESLLSREGPADQKVGKEKKTDHPKGLRDGTGKGHPAAKGHYKTRDGDTLSSIAGREDVYGDPMKWTVLYRHNLKELGKLKVGGDLHERPLALGMKLKTVTAHEFREHLKRRAEDVWVVNVLSTAFYDKLVKAAVEVINMGYPAYVTKIKSEGKEWIRLRAGFFKTKAGADEEAKKIQSALRLPKIWTAKASKEEFEKFAGY
ncbi:MAG: DotU/TssL family secretion system protein [Deltaproteobacteria bacterium]|nr:DotU/TssL family secretion system protein [Deltaproteobacteria bacterium]